MNYKACFGCLMISLTCVSSEKFEKAIRNHKRQIVLIVASKDYQPVEYKDTKRVLNQAGFNVITVSPKSGYAYATDGTRTLVDKVLNKFDYKKYDGIFIIGGPGAHAELDTQLIYSTMRNAYSSGKAIGAICYSPRILAKAGILEGKKATGWNDDNKLDDIFKQYQVIYNKQPVVTDGNIITADGPNSAQAFGKAIIKILKDK